MNEATQPSKEQIEKEAKLKEIRFKAWDECTIEEKLEKIKMSIKDMSYNDTNINITLGNIAMKLENLNKHSHLQNGEIVVPLNNNSGTNGMGVARGNILLNKHVLD